MNAKKSVLTAIFCMVQILLAVTIAHAQSAIYSQAFTGGATATAQCTAFNTFSAGLNPGIYLSVKISGTYDPTGIICQDPVIANAVANALKTSTSYTSPICNGNVWSVCNRGSYMELWLNPGTQCNGSNCPNPGYIIRPCISNGNWGGVNSITCNTTISQTMTLEFFFGIPCNGVPTANVTAPFEVCPNKPFEVKLSVPYTGTTFQWEYSTNGTTWKTYTGTVNQVGTFTDQIVVPTWYRCKLTCLATSQTYTTAPFKVNMAPFYYCYCDGSKATAGAGSDIGNVTVTSISNNSTLLTNGTATPFFSNTTATNTYTDLRYTVPPVPMYRDSNYLISVSQITSAATFTAGTAAVYIDYNRNGTFDLWERVLLETTNQNPSTIGLVRDTFKMPDTAQFGLTGMRVIMRSGTTAPDTCASYTDGETEDYLIDIRHIPCTGKPNAGVIKGDTSMCVGYDYLVTDTTYEKDKHGINRSWYVSADNVFWTPITGSASKDTLMRDFMNGQPLFYKMEAICTHTNDTSYTAVHKVNLKPSYKCYCYSQAIGGLNDTSDVGGFKIYNFEVTDGGAHLGNPRAKHKRQDYTDIQPIEMWVDSVYNFHVFHTMPTELHSDAKVTVFVDFDNNHQYDIPEERIYTGFTSVGYHTLLGQVIIPNAAIVDVPTGLRVIVNNNVGPNTPSDEACGTYLSGETEDYMVIFRRPFNVRVDDVNGLSHVRIYPNPANDKVTVMFNAAAVNDNVEVKLLSVTGQLVKSYSYRHDGGRFLQQIDLSGQAKGVYFIEINAGGLKSTQKLILQ
ncbi:GEVED domain-containing protein [Polluticoccus soli]|uniref:GEVED domain-containing protein n=1 Tax=Polluticoccus soli TaxID=3034150 RepID=UPI0023E23673|nr:GEVED domain-containing protein [Flavipsychrobacter sp. JY13-12]